MTRDSSKKMDATAKEGMEIMYKIEKQIQENTSIDLKNISSDEIEKQVDDLKNTITV